MEPLDARLTGLTYFYEGSQFKYSKMWIDNITSKGIDFYAKIPIEILGKKISYEVIGEDSNGDEVQSLKYKIRGKGYLVINAKVPRGKAIEPNAI